MGPRSGFSKPCQGAAEKSANATRKALHSAASKATVRFCLARGSQPVGMSNKRTTVHPGEMKLSLFVFHPDAVQSVCDEGLSVQNGGAAGFPDGGGQAACGVEGGLRAKLGTETLSQTIQQAGGAQHKAVLQAGRGALAQNGRRGLRGKVDLRQLGGVFYQCAQ